MNEGGYFYDNYTSKRWDNTIKYHNKFGALSAAVMLGLDEQPGNAKRNLGASLGCDPAAPRQPHWSLARFGVSPNFHVFEQTPLIMK